jgi:hypothetical protein
VGRGSAGTDINAIPMSAIHHIEVLRDGAAAQYGSDAIAGVINIVLKSNVNETAFSGTLGTTSKGDGDLYSASVNRGFALGENGGFINLTAEARVRGETNRAGPDTLRVNPPRVTQRIGDSDAKDAYFWWNGALPIDKDSEFYAFGGVSKRTGDSSGFYRQATAAPCRPCIRMASCRTSVPRSKTCRTRSATAATWPTNGSSTCRSTMAPANWISTKSRPSTCRTGMSRNRAAAFMRIRLWKPIPAN